MTPDSEELTYRRPPLNPGQRLRRALGAAVTDGFFWGSSQTVRFLPVSRPRLHGVERLRNLSYLGSGGPSGEHLCDVWRPRGTRSGDRLPVVLYIHGGGFRFLSKDTHWPFALLFAREGHVVVSINYRLAPKHPYPAAISDVCDAWRWLVHNVARFGGDPTRIAIAGESAGANLVTALTLATVEPRPEPFARAVYELGVVPRASLPACGVLQVTDPERFNFSSSFLHDRIAEVTDAYLHGARVPRAWGFGLADPLVTLEQSARTARPLPPFFITCGTWDVLIDDSQRLERALQRLGATTVARYYPREPHAFHAFVFTPHALEAWRETYRFLREHLHA